MSTRKIVVLTTSAQVAPAASRTARQVGHDPLGLRTDAALDDRARLRVERRLAGGEEQAVGDDALAVRADRGRGPGGRDGSAGHVVGSSSAGWVTMRRGGDERLGVAWRASSVPSPQARPDQVGRGGRVRLGSIERPEGRTRAGQPERAPEKPVQGTPERHDPGQDRGRRGQQVVGHGEHAGPRHEVRGRQPRAELLREVDRRHPDRAVADARAARRTRRRPRASRPGRRASRAGPPATRAGRAAARRAHHDPRRGPARRPRRTARPSRAGPRRAGARRDRARRPTPRARASIGRGRVRRPAGEPGGDRDPLLEAGRERGRGPRAAGPAAADGRARRRRAPGTRRCRRAGPGSKPSTWRLSAWPPAVGEAQPVGQARAARRPSAGRGTRPGRRPTTASVRLSLAGASRSTGVRRRDGSVAAITSAASRDGPAGRPRSGRAPRAGPATPPPRGSAGAARGRCRPPSRAAVTSRGVERQLAGQDVVEHLAALAEARLDEPPELVLGVGVEAVVGVERLDDDDRRFDGRCRLERLGADGERDPDPGVVLHEDRQVAHLPGRRRDPLRDLALDHEHRAAPAAAASPAARAGSGW